MHERNDYIPPFQEPRFYKTKSDIPEDIRIQIVELLNRTLATTIDLRSQIKQAIWYMRGATFYQFYLLFNEIADQIEEQIDAISLRISSLASTPLVSTRIVAQSSQLPAYPFNIIPTDENLKALIDRVSLYGQSVRIAIEQATDLEDADTVHLYTEISCVVDKHLWLLESHLLPQ